LSRSGRRLLGAIVVERDLDDLGRCEMEESRERRPTLKNAFVRKDEGRRESATSEIFARSRKGFRVGPPWSRGSAAKAQTRKVTEK
jgi:hypothetical protein